MEKFPTLFLVYSVKMSFCHPIIGFGSHVNFSLRYNYNVSSCSKKHKKEKSNKGLPGPVCLQIPI